MNLAFVEDLAFVEASSIEDVDKYQVQVWSFYFCQLGGRSLFVLQGEGDSSRGELLEGGGGTQF